MAETTRGVDGHIRFAVPLDYIVGMLKRRGVRSG
jgi:hypothetical protein